MRTLATILPLKSNFSGKVQPFDVIDGTIKMKKIVEYQKTSLKMKNCQTFYEA